jgi:xanthine dehydrogenase YagS FAD-binding subunit
MEAFEYRRVNEVAGASAAARAVPGSAFIAGGTNLTDYLTLGAARPRLLIDINHLPRRYAQIQSDGTRLRLGALVRMADAEDHPAVRAQYPVIRQTLTLAASRQIRNMASLGGNLLQRTRCEYFRGSGWPCNKRRPGSGCAALEGLNRAHAVLGTSEQCIAAYAGDFAQALIALDATIETAGGAGGPRRIPMARLHRQPGATPQIESSLAPGELITFIDVPAGAWTRRSLYLKVRDRESYQFALAAAAVALDLEDGAVREARIALGGVATVPWRAHEAEAVLIGKRLDEPLAMRAAEAAFADARARANNAFKIPLGRRTLVRALLEAQALDLREV